MSSLSTQCINLRELQCSPAHHVACRALSLYWQEIAGIETSATGAVFIRSRHTSCRRDRKRPIQILPDSVAGTFCVHTVPSFRAHPHESERETRLGNDQRRSSKRLLRSPPPSEEKQRDTILSVRDVDDGLLTALHCSGRAKCTQCPLLFEAASLARRSRRWHPSLGR
jgi:hypothetical protein